MAIVVSTVSPATIVFNKQTLRVCKVSVIFKILCADILSDWRFTNWTTDQTQYNIYICLTSKPPLMKYIDTLTSDPRILISNPTVSLSDHQGETVLAVHWHFLLQFLRHLDKNLFIVSAIYKLHPAEAQ
jgi:hypothetical protein